MGTLSLPQMLDAGTITLTSGSRDITGDSDTLANVLSGQELVVVGHQGVWSVATDAVDDGGGDGDFTILELSSFTDTAQAYVFSEPLDPEIRNIIAAADTVGTFSGRSAHNSESAGYLYLSTDGAGSATLPLLFERVTSTSGTWAAVDDIEDVDTVDEGGNPVLNAQGFVTDPYIEDAAKDDTDAFIRAPWYCLCQANDVTESDSTSDVTFNRGIKLTKTTASGRMGLAQIILASDMPNLLGVGLTLSGKARLSAGGDLRFAVLSDDVTTDEPKDLVNDWTSTTYTTGNFFVSSDTMTVEGVGELTLPAAEALSFDVAIDDTVASTQGRIFVFMWTEASQSTSATMEVTDVALKVGGGRPAVLKPPPVETVKTEVRQSLAEAALSNRNRIVNPSGLAIEPYYKASGVSDAAFCASYPWYVLCNTGTIDTDHLQGSGFGQGALLKVTSTASGQRFGIAQCIHRHALYDIKELPLTLSLKALGENGFAFRYAVLERSLPGSAFDLVNDWTSGTFTAGNFFAADTTVLAIGSATLDGTDAASISIVSDPVAISSNGCFVFAWIDQASTSSGQSFFISNVQLEVGEQATAYTPRLFYEELAAAGITVPPGSHILTADDFPSSFTTLPVIASGSLSGSSVDIVEASSGLWATYRELHLSLRGMSSGTASRGASILVSTNSGSSFISSGYTGLTAISGAATSSFTNRLVSTRLDSTAAQTNDADFIITGHQGGTYVKGSGVCQRSDGSITFVSGCYQGGTSAINAISIDHTTSGSGNFDAGTYSLVGVR